MGFFSCDGCALFGLETESPSFRGKGFHLAVAVLVSPVGVPLAVLVAHGDLMETALLLGPSVAAMGV